jgi:hypothetical protein
MTMFLHFSAACEHLAAAKVAVKLAERYPRQHRRIDCNRELASIRQLDRDDIVDAEPKRDEMGRQPLGAAIILAASRALCSRMSLLVDSTQ